METVLSFLNSHPEPMLSFGSAFLESDPTFTFLCWRAYKREAEEARKLLSVLKSFVPPICSPLGQRHDTIRFRQMLCPDPSCKVCNKTTAEVSRLLFPEPVEDATPCVSPVASTAPVTESSFTLAPSAQPPEDPVPASLPEPHVPVPSILSPDRTTPLVDTLSPSPLGDSLPPEPVSSLDSIFPVDHFPPQSRASSPFLLYHTQREDHVLQPEPSLSLNTIFSLDPTLSQDMNPSPSHSVNLTDSFTFHCTPPTLSASPPPDCTLTVTESKLTPTSLKSVTESSSLENPGRLAPSVSTVTGTNHSSMSISEFSWPAHAKEWFPSCLSQCDFNQEALAIYSSEVSLRGNLATNSVEAGNLSFLNPDVLDLLERQVKKRGDFLMLKEKEMKKETFPDQLGPDYQLNSLGKLFRSISEKHDSAASVPFQDMEGKPKKLLIHQEFPYSKTFGDHIHQQHIQLFWGLPSLHSESLVSILASAGYSSDFVSFNRLSLPLSLPEIQPQTLPQTSLQSQYLRFTQVSLQAHLQSQLQSLPPSPPQIRTCGVSFSRPQKEEQSVTQEEIHCLEWHVLQKQLEGLVGVPSVVQKSQEAFCPPAPNFPQHYRPYQADAPEAIIPGNFPLSIEVRKLLEHHLRKRLIQHRWGLPRRIRESLALMQPPDESPETPESKSTYGLSWLHDFKSRSSMDLNGEGLSQRKSFYERSLEMLHLVKDMRKGCLEKDMMKDQGHSPENIPKDHLSKDSKISSVSVLGSDSAKDPERHKVSLSGNNSRASGVNLDQKLLEDALKTHLNDKLGQIKEGSIPEVVDSSWRTVEKTLSLPNKSHAQKKHRNLAPSMGGNYCLDTSQELPFINSSTKQRLEGHIKCFYMRMIWGLPCKVVESIQIFQMRESPSLPFPYSNLPSSTTLISEMDPKTEVSKPLRESPQTFWGEKITNSVPIMDCPLPATSLVDKEGQGTLRQSLPDTNHELTEDFQIIKDGRKTFASLKHRNIDKTSQSKTVIPNKRSPEQPTSHTGTGRTPRDQSISRDTTGMLQDKGMVDRNLKHFSTASMSRETFKAKELHALQSQSNNTIITRELLTSQRKSVTSSKVETNLMTKSPRLPRPSVLQEPDPSYLKSQLINELKFTLEARQHSQAQGSPNDTSHASDSLAPTDSLWNDSPTHAKSVPSGYMAAPQVLNVHLEDRGISMEQQQEPWVPKHVLGKFQDKNFRPATKRVNPQGPKAEEWGGGDAGLGTSQTRRKTYPVHDKKSEETFGSRSSQSLSEKEQSPPESNFGKKIKHLLQWLHPRMKCKGQESSVEKGSSMPASIQRGGPGRSRAVFTGTTEGQTLMTDRKCRHGRDTTCLQEPLCTHMKFGETQHKAKARSQAGPVQGLTFNFSIPYHKACTKACSQEALSAGQSCPISSRLIRNRDRHSQKMEGFKGQSVWLPDSSHFGKKDLQWDGKRLSSKTNGYMSARGPAISSNKQLHSEGFSYLVKPEKYECPTEAEGKQWGGGEGGLHGAKLSHLAEETEMLKEDWRVREKVMKEEQGDGGPCSSKQPG
ncbi:LOW QUALITY PROTEIN: spermatogenesis-associated protein 31D3-like [Trichechus inunguis]